MRAHVLGTALLFFAATSGAQIQPQTLSFEPGEVHTGLDYYRLFSICEAQFFSHAVGLPNAIVSGHCVGQGYGGGYPTFIRSATPFLLQSGYFTSIFENGVSLFAWGFKEGDVMQCCEPWGFSQGGASYFAGFGIGASGPSWFNFNWSDVTTVAFATTNGTIAGSPQGFTSGPFAIDDLAISIAPEPTTGLLLATGFAVIWTCRKRRGPPSKLKGAA